MILIRNFTISPDFNLADVCPFLSDITLQIRLLSAGAETRACQIFELMEHVSLLTVRRPQPDGRLRAFKEHHHSEHQRDEAAVHVVLDLGVRR